MKVQMRLLYKGFLLVLLFVIGLIEAALIHPVLGLVCSPASARQKRDWLESGWFKCFAFIINLKLTKQGEPLGGMGLLVSNHISWLDIVVFSQLFPSYFVAKSEMLTWPVVGYLTKHSGAVFIRRGDKQQVKATNEAIAWHLKQKSMVVIFPEGTTTSGDGVLPFHSSLIQPALLTKSVIHIAALQYLGEAKTLAPFIGEDTFVQHLLKMLAMEKIEAHVSFLASINASGKTRLSISHEARSMILERITGECQDETLTEPLLKQAH